ncbi:MAG: trimeric intracellular cation channel family protein [Acidobacteria bacterium]|nr:trimeric intracellular cation channel family protein [Acidobacteriota bacterium]
MAVTFEGYLANTVTVIDVVGTFAFAVSGAIAGVRRHFDLFGVLVLSFAASTAGGITRDLLIGATPPAALSTWLYLAVSMAAGLVIFLEYRQIRKAVRLRNLLLVFDAAGLALFAVTGTQKALAFNLSPVMAPILGVLSGIGGGILRDMLVTETPSVFHPGELYAVAALAGASVVVVTVHFGGSPVMAAVLGIAVTFALRMLAVRRRWTLPVADVAEEQPEKSG